MAEAATSYTSLFSLHTTNNVTRKHSLSTLPVMKTQLFSPGNDETDLARQYISVGDVMGSVRTCVSVSRNKSRGAKCHQYSLPCYSSPPVLPQHYIHCNNTTTSTPSISIYIALHTYILCNIYISSIINSKPSLFAKARRV